MTEQEDHVMPSKHPITGYTNRSPHVGGAQQRRSANEEIQDGIVQDRKTLQNRRHACNRWIGKNVVFDYQLFRSESKFPRTREMTPFEAADENRTLWRQAMDRDSDTLWRWDRIKQDNIPALYIRLNLIWSQTQTHDDKSQFFAIIEKEVSDAGYAIRPWTNDANGPESVA